MKNIKTWTATQISVSVVASNLSKVCEEGVGVPFFLHKSFSNTITFL